MTSKKSTNQSKRFTIIKKKGYTITVDNMTGIWHSKPNQCDSSITVTNLPYYWIIGFIIKTYKQSFKTMYNPNDLRELTKDIFYTRRDIRPNDEVVRYYCENGYGLSVACHDHSYGGKDGLYEIALLKGDKLHYDSHEWQDVRGWLTKAEVWNWLKIVSEY